MLQSCPPPAWLLLRDCIVQLVLEVNKQPGSPSRLDSFTPPGPPGPALHIPRQTTLLELVHSDSANNSQVSLGKFMDSLTPSLKIRKLAIFVLTGRHSRLHSCLTLLARNFISRLHFAKDNNLILSCSGFIYHSRHRPGWAGVCTETAQRNVVSNMFIANSASFNLQSI